MNFVRALRNKVSGDKKRYNTGIFDLDLTYITDRIIAMAFPASGLEATYRNDINEVSDMLTSEHNGHFRIFNLTERLYDYSKFQWRVATVGWPDHHPPPLCQLFRIVEEMHEWLLADPENVCIAHCLAGKGRTGTVIASYMLYSGLFNKLEDAERYFAIRRSFNNWGVTGPSQQRYTEFFWKILSSKKRPNPRPLRFKSITFIGSMKFSMGSKKGFCPFITINDSTIALQPRLLWQSQPNQMKAMVADNQCNVTVDLDPICVIHGDAHVSIEHAGSFGGILTKEKVGRFDFNSAMIGDDFCLTLTKNDIDDANNDKRVPADFSAILLFEPLDEDAYNRDQRNPPLETDEFWERIFSRKLADSGMLCFWPNADNAANIAQARALANSRMGVTVERGGYLTKQGHKVKNWKRRWFVLHADSLEYYEKPKDVTARGTIKLDDVQTVQQLDPKDAELPNSFIIITNWNDYICSADNEADMEGWMEDLLLALHIRDLKKQGLEYDSPHSSPSLSHQSAAPASSSSAAASPDTYARPTVLSDDQILGQLVVHPISVENWIIPGKVDGYSTIQFGTQKYKATFMPNSGDYAYKDVSFDITRGTQLDQLIIQMWEAHSLFPDEIIGEVRINLGAVANLMERDGPVRIEETYSFRKRSAQLADLKLALTFKPSNIVLAERASKTAEVRETVEQLRRAEQSGTQVDPTVARNRLAASRRGVRESGGGAMERKSGNGLDSSEPLSSAPPPSSFAPPSASQAPAPMIIPTSITNPTPVVQPRPFTPAASPVSLSSSGNNYGYDPTLLAAASKASSEAQSKPTATPLSSSGNNYGYDPALIASMMARQQLQNPQPVTANISSNAPVVIVSTNTGTFIPASPTPPPTSNQ